MRSSVTADSPIGTRLVAVQVERVVLNQSLGRLRRLLVVL